MFTEINERDRCFIAFTNKGEYRMVHAILWADAWNYFQGGPDISKRKNIRLVKLDRSWSYCSERCFNGEVETNCDTHRQEVLKNFFDNGVLQGYFVSN